MATKTRKSGAGAAALRAVGDSSSAQKRATMLIGQVRGLLELARTSLDGRKWPAALGHLAATRAPLADAQRVMRAGRTVERAELRARPALAPRPAPPRAAPPRAKAARVAKRRKK